MQIPRRGQIAIFDRSWYGRVLVERVEGLTPIPDWIRAYEEINEFERTLASDRTLFVKFWLHISQEEQLRRFIALTMDKAEAWQISAEDWEHHRKYDEYLAAVNDMLENTHTEVAPWYAVPATDQYYATFQIMSVTINRLEAALGEKVTVWPKLSEIEAHASSGAKADGQTSSSKSKKDKRDDDDDGSTKPTESEVSPPDEIAPTVDGENVAVADTKPKRRRTTRRAAPSSKKA
ncbi:MAG: hypothetical protein HC802_20595 [Caldilineaceae bacterium]|nr:hypothetical protein [Caldilineaceae bacterium]